MIQRNYPPTVYAWMLGYYKALVDERRMLDVPLEDLNPGYIFVLAEKAYKETTQIENSDKPYKLLKDTWLENEALKETNKELRKTIARLNGYDDSI